MQARERRAQPERRREALLLLLLLLRGGGGRRHRRFRRRDDALSARPRSRGRGRGDRPREGNDERRRRRRKRKRRRTRGRRRRRRRRRGPRRRRPGRHTLVQRVARPLPRRRRGSPARRRCRKGRQRPRHRRGSARCPARLSLRAEPHGGSAPAKLDVARGNEAAVCRAAREAVRVDRRRRRGRILPFAVVAIVVSGRGRGAGEDHAAAGQPPFDQRPLLLLLLVRAPAKASKDRGCRSRRAKRVRGAVTRGRPSRGSSRPRGKGRAVPPRRAPRRSAAAASVAPDPSSAPGRGRDGREGALRPRVEERQRPVAPGESRDERCAEGCVEADGELGRLCFCLVFGFREI